MIHTSQAINLIYAGGTFGCHGKPLNVLPKEQFLPNLTKLITDDRAVTILDNTIIKDSSTLTPTDFVDFYQLIKQAYNNGARHFLLITGTDSLSFLAAFLTVSLGYLPICLVVTGSMLPLFDPNNPVLERLPDSDAWNNLQIAFDFFNKNQTGIYISFNQQILHGDSSQKMHTSDKNAFVGETLKDRPPHTYPSLDIVADTSLCNDIHLYHCIPNHPDYLYKQLTRLIDMPPTAVILLGFGAGNIPFHPNLKQVFDTLINQGFMLIIGSSCPFGAISDDYAAGAWQYELGALSGGAIPLPTLYAFALWICLTNPINQRLATWQALTQDW